MTGPGDLLEAVVARLRAQLGDRVSVEAHEGVFTEAQLEQYGARCPAVRVAITGFGRFTRASSGEAVVPVNLAAVCLAKDVQPIGAPLVHRHTAVQALAIAVGIAADKSQFGLSGVYPPEEMTARNQFSEAAGKAGMAIWQVMWTTRIITGTAADQSIAALTNLFVNQVLFAAPGAIDGVDPIADAALEQLVTDASVPPEAV